MTVRTVNNRPAALHGETVRCLFAIELSKQSWVVGFITPLTTKISRRTVGGGDWKGLLSLIDEVRARVGRETGRPVEVLSCYEAGYDGFWLHRQLIAHGISITLLIRRVCRSTGGRDESRRIGSTRNGCCIRSWRTCAASRRCGAWSEYPASPKKTRDGCTESGTVWSRNEFSTSTASKGFVRSKESMITNRCTRRRWRVWNNCVRHRASDFRRG